VKKRPDQFLVSVLSAALLLAAAASAQQTATTAPASASSQPASGQAPAAAKTFSQQDLDQLLAPIALYPDNLLAQVLMAATYPLEVVQAARWLAANPNVKDKALEDAMQKQTWDPSVKGLTAVPQVLKQMDEKIDWTQKLGDAFLAQQADVMSTVQSLRAKAKESGNLKSSPEMAVKTETVENKTVYVIESTKTETVYVPTYNPSVVYGTWPYPAYPPYYMYPPAYVYAPGLTFAAGVFVGAAIWGGCGWGSNNVYINHNNYNNFNRNNINSGNIGNGNRGNGNIGGGRDSWQHNADHRGGVPYRDQKTAGQYGRGNENRPQTSDSFRGRDQGGGADRPSAGTRDMGGRDTGGRDTGGRDMGGRDTSSRGGASASTRDAGSRGGGGGGGFSGMSSGGGARAASSRGGSSFGGGRGGGGRRR
jgi:hypothetical protein